MSMDISITNINISGSQAPRRSAEDRAAKLFDTIDPGGTGTISKQQFEQAFDKLHMPKSLKSGGADALFAKLDPNGAGSISKADFVSGMAQQLKQAHGSHHRAGNDHDSDDGGAQAAGQTGTSPDEIKAMIERIASMLGSSSASGDTAAASPSSTDPGSFLNITA